MSQKNTILQLDSEKARNFFLEEKVIVTLTYHHILNLNLCLKR